MAKTPLYIAVFIALTSPYSAFAIKNTEQCRTSCYEAEHECTRHSTNPLASHQCGKEQFACQMSCQGNHKMEHYNKRGSMQYSFRPILEDLI